MTGTLLSPTQLISPSISLTLGPWLQACSTGSPHVYAICLHLT